jgi:hypothetical protein
MAAADFDELMGGVRGLVIALGDTLTSNESAEVDELLDHAELGEALRTLAWLIVEEHKHIAAADIDEIRALAQRMGISDELPQTLDEHGVDDA